MTPKKLKTLLSTASIAVLLSAVPALSGQVVLTSLNGETTLTGELIEIDGDYLIVETLMGQMRIGADMVTCAGEGCPVVAVSEMNFSGSRTLTDRLMPVLIEGYAKHIDGNLDILDGTDVSNHYELRSQALGRGELNLQTSGSASAIASLLEGSAEFALTTRPATEVELAAAKKAGIRNLRDSAHERVIGYDGLLLVANPENGINAISEQAAAQIFAGQITNWAELGGPDAPINVYVREQGSGARSLFDELVMRSNRLNMTNSVTELASDKAVADAVKNDPNGFGFTSMVYANAHVKPFDIEGVCGLRTPANAFTIKTGEYPLTRPLYLYSKSRDLDGHAKSFVEFIATDEGQAMVVDAGFVGQTISSEKLNAQGMRVASTLLLQQEEVSGIDPIRNMLSLLLASERLSTTVRFRQGASRLDAGAIADVERLGAMLTEAKYANKQFFFMGFSDSVGRGDLNQLLALKRAEFVRQTLLETHPELEDRIKVRSVGFGEISPLGCNETRTGRSINRRVEVWMQDVAAQDT